MISPDDQDAESKVEGALTQGLRLLRQQADHSPIAFSPPESPVLFTQASLNSPFLSTQPEDNEGSFLFQTANDSSLAEQVGIFDSTADVDEIPATPAAAAAPPPLPPRRLTSVVTVRRNLSPQRDARAPLSERLRALATRNPAPICAYCSKSDGRKETIQCGTCKGHVHSVSCAGFLNHRQATHTPFTCRKCVAPPILRLPHASTPLVSHRVVISSHGPPADNSLPVNDYFPVDLSFDSPQSSPAAVPHPPQLHASPDHAHLASRATEPTATPPPFSLDELLETKIVLLRHCPKTARRELASHFNSVWSEVLNNADNADNWSIAFAAAKLVLFLPPGKKTFKEKAATVKQRIKAFREGRLEELWRNATRKPKGRRPNTAPQAANNARRATTLAQEGQFGQAAKALLSQGLDFDSDEALESMRSKHPFSPPPLPLPPPDASPYSFNATETLDAIYSFHSLSAGGASGCRAAHFREAISSDRGNGLLTTMTRVINFLAAGKTPAAISPFLCGGNLFAALKKSGGHRPIAVGETIRRWTAKCIARKATADSADYLAPHQLGVTVKGGAEAIIHAAGAIFHDNSIDDEDKWVLQIDFKNAFNLISRAKMLEEVRKRCPKAAKWAETCYASSSHLFFGDKRLTSSSGAQQGDPLASLFFSLVLQPLIEMIKDECPDLLLLVFFLDDGTIIGRRCDLQKVFDLLTAEGPALGLHLNPAKSLVWCGSNLPVDLDGTDPLARGVPPAAAAGYQLLGAPVGNIPFSRDVVEKRIQKIAEIFDLLPAIDDAQTEFALLRSCFSLPKLTYCLRTCDPAHLLLTYKNFDSLQFATFSQLFGHPLNANARTQAFLPVKMGGVGLRSAEHHSSGAFIASNIQARPVVDQVLSPHITRRSLHNAFSLLQKHTGNPTLTSEELLPPNSNQHSLSRDIDAYYGKTLLAHASPRDSARLLSLSLPHAGDFLDAVPSPSLGLHMDTRSFGAAIGYRLGLPILKPEECRAISCAQQSDATGDLAMHCHDDNGLKSGRHD